VAGERGDAVAPDSLMSKQMKTNSPGELVARKFGVEVSAAGPPARVRPLNRRIAARFRLVDRVERDNTVL
jgi:hypothetical protein